MGRERELDVLRLGALRRGVRVERKGRAYDLYPRVRAVAVGPLVRNGLPVGGVGCVRQKLSGQVRALSDVEFVIGRRPGSFLYLSAELVAARGRWSRGR